MYKNWQAFESLLDIGLNHNYSRSILIYCPGWELLYSELKFWILMLIIKIFEIDKLFYVLVTRPGKQDVYGRLDANRLSVCDKESYLIQQIALFRRFHCACWLSSLSNAWIEHPVKQWRVGCKIKNQRHWKTHKSYITWNWLANQHLAHEMSFGLMETPAALSVKNLQGFEVTG